MYTSDLGVAGFSESCDDNVPSKYAVRHERADVGPQLLQSFFSTGVDPVREGDTLTHFLKHTHTHTDSDAGWIPMMVESSSSPCLSQQAASSQRWSGDTQYPQNKTASSGANRIWWTCPPTPPPTPTPTPPPPPDPWSVPELVIEGAGDRTKGGVWTCLRAGGSCCEGK